MSGKKTVTTTEHRVLLAGLARDVRNDLSALTSTALFGTVSEGAGEDERTRAEGAQVLTELLYCASLISMGLRRSEEYEETWLRYVRAGLHRAAHSPLLEHLRSCPGAPGGDGAHEG